MSVKLTHGAQCMRTVHHEMRLTEDLHQKLRSTALHAKLPENQIGSLPFNGRRRLGRDVEADAVDTLHFVDYPSRHFPEHLVGKMVPICRHVVRSLDRPE